MTTTLELAASSLGNRLFLSESGDARRPHKVVLVRQDGSMLFTRNFGPHALRILLSNGPQAAADLLELAAPTPTTPEPEPEEGVSPEKVRELMREKDLTYRDAFIQLHAQNERTR